jgi:hypothetical protein
MLRRLCGKGGHMRTSLFFLVLSALLLAGSPAQAGKVSKDGYFKGIRLAGKVKVVEHFPDVKVQVVESFPDIDVQLVNAFPDAVGKWQMVENFPDFTIQFVNSFPDIKVRFVSAFPGVK